LILKSASCLLLDRNLDRNKDEALFAALDCCGCNPCAEACRIGERCKFWCMYGETKRQLASRYLGRMRTNP
jgi:hypothetical protein